MHKRILVSVLAVLLLCGMLSACGSKDKTPAYSDVEIESVEPIPQKEQLDYTQDLEQVARIASLRATFTELAETPAADFWMRAENGGLTVVGYLGASETVRVPAAVNGVPVKAIADEAFSDNEKLKALYLPDSIVSIGASILRECTALTALRTPILGATPDSTQYLGYLFGADSYVNNPRDIPAKLVYLEIGGNAKKLADYALFECNDLLCITLPESMTEIGVYSLYACTRLMALNTEHLTALSANALDGCAALTRLDFGADMTTFGLGCLEGCDSLRQLTLPFVGQSKTENTYLGYLFGAELPEYSKGFYPKKLVNVILLEGVTTLDRYAFFQCESLTSIKLPTTLTQIGVRAFEGCVRLETVMLPAALSEIGASAFYRCLSLSSVDFAENSNLQVLGINCFYACYALRKIELPATLSELPASCFADCASLREIDLGGVARIGKNAFHRCKALGLVRAKGTLQISDGNPELERVLFPEA
ncbi:MAG: leucine-rich repeat domain-containing protein [Ruminococcaceae bacterium]|nr:leucine-rich repeat domain-containing protein [Oscillospiraceae bacterium]